MTTPDFAIVDEFYYSPDTDAFMFDSAHGTRFAHAGERLYAQIKALVEDWTAETYREAVIYHRPLVHRVVRNSGARMKG